MQGIQLQLTYEWRNHNIHLSTCPAFNNFSYAGKVWFDVTIIQTISICHIPGFVSCVLE
jgi:hypothetical protein